MHTLARALSSPFIRQPHRIYYCTLRSDTSDLRAQLLDEIKVAMKNRDSLTSTTLRSVLSEIQSAEKSSKDGKLSSSATTMVVRRAVQRRAEAASAFYDANRSDLAAKEEKEVKLLSRFLPPLLSTEDIDAHLKAAMQALPTGSDPKKSLGLALKGFYSKVDKSTVEATLVKDRAQVLLQSTSL